MREHGRKIIAILSLISVLVTGNLIPQNSIQARTATTATKTAMVTLDQKHPEKCVNLTTVSKEMKYTSNAAFTKAF